MCGINGIKTAAITQQHFRAVQLMNKQLHSRGPDTSGVFASPTTLLGHTLLAINGSVDRSTQPAEIENIVIILNGEIYNYRSYQRILKNKHSFTPQNETETLISLYLEYGESFLNKIDGEFAFALYDKAKDKLILAVDHLGIKPLYYHFSNESLIFSSQINSLLKSKLIQKLFNDEGLYDCFTLGSCLNQKTLFWGISKLTGGNYLTFTHKLGIIPYFSLSEYNNTIVKKKTSSMEKLKTTIEHSITTRSYSNTKIGISLSGGVDSSILAWYVSKRRPDTHLLSLDLKKYYPKIKDSEYQQSAANTIGLGLTRIIPDIAKPADIVEKILSFMDDFAFHPIIYALYFLYQATNKLNIRVLLSGDGMDELFLGYSYYPALSKLIKSNNKFLLFNRMRAKKEVNPIHHGIYSNFLHDNHLFYSNHFYLDQTIKSFLFKNIDCPPTEQRISQYLAHFSHLDYLNQCMIGELSFKFRQLFTIVDRIASNQHIESRFPYLSKEMIHASLTTPSSEKIQNNSGKYVVKKIAQSIFSRSFAFRQKDGLTFSIKFFLKKHKIHLLNEILNKNVLIKNGYFSRNYIQLIFLQILKNDNLTSNEEFLIFFFLWFDFYFQNKNLLNYLD